MRENGGHKAEVDNRVHIRGHFGEGSGHWDDGPAVFSIRPEFYLFERPFCLCGCAELGVMLADASEVALLYSETIKSQTSFASLEDVCVTGFRRYDVRNVLQSPKS